MKHTNNRKQSAFTLVELIIVIVILGILSAFAIPKYINITDDSRQAVITSISGALKSAIHLVHSKAIVDGVENEASASITLNDGTSIQTVYGYPAGNSRGIGSVLDQHFPREIVSHPSGGNSWMFTNADSHNCYVRYSQATQGSTYQLSTLAECGASRH